MLTESLLSVDLLRGFVTCSNSIPLWGTLGGLSNREYRFCTLPFANCLWPCQDVRYIRSDKSSHLVLKTWLWEMKDKNQRSFKHAFNSLQGKKERWNEHLSTGAELKWLECLVWEGKPYLFISWVLIFVCVMMSTCLKGNMHWNPIWACNLSFIAITFFVGDAFHK